MPSLGIRQAALRRWLAESSRRFAVRWTIAAALIGSAADADQAQERFPIGFWYGPPASANTWESWQTVAGAGFTVVGPCYGYGEADNQAMLRFCDRLGVKAIVVDSRIRPEMVAQRQWRTIVRQVVSDYEHHPALLGYYVHDEPSARWFPVLAEIHSEFRQCDPGRLPYINLYPNYASPSRLSAATHRQYVEQFVATVRPNLLSYDHYPLLNTGEDRADYFENLETIRSVAGAARVPVWGIVQLAPHDRYRDPTAEELQWQVFTSLAYGVKGLFYFTYWPPPALAASAIVDAEGKPTRRYAIVQELNGKIQALGPTLLTLRSTAVYHTGPIPPGCTRLPTDALFRLPSDQPLILGCFENDQRQPLVILVNRDYRGSQELVVELRPDVEEVSSVDPKDGQLAAVPCDRHCFSLRLEPGEGRLFVLKLRSASREPFRPAQEIDFDFEEHDEDWRAAHSLSPPVAEEGVLRSTITGDDPYFCRELLAVAPDRYRRIRVRLKTPARRAQFYWQTSEHSEFSDDRHITFATHGDDQFHDYVIELSEHPGWKGKGIRAIRLDPAAGEFTPRETVELDYVRGE